MNTDSSNKTELADPILTSELFLKRYGQYFGSGRMDAIDNTGRLIIEGSAEGAYIYDTEGRRYLDLLNAGGITNLGHRNPKMLDAMMDATRNMEFGSLFHFSESMGKLARDATGRSEILHWEGSYHGHTGISLTMMHADALREWAEPLVPDIRKIKFDDIDALHNSISERTAAIVIEPVRTAAGGHKPSAEYLHEVRRLCDRYDTKLIVDEVVTGMGRLGHVWGCDYDGIEPDLLVAGKGFSGGMYPVAAVVMRPEMLDFWGDNGWRSLSSYAWPNIGCAVSLAAIEETERLLPAASAMGDELHAALNDLLQRYSDVISGVRRIGLLFAMELNGEKLEALQFANQIFELSVIVVVSASNTSLPSVRFYPPLIMGSEQVGELAEKAETVIKAAL